MTDLPLSKLALSFLNESLEHLAAGREDDALERLDLPLPPSMRSLLADIAKEECSRYRKEAERLLSISDAAANRAGLLSVSTVDASQPRAFSLENPSHLLGWIAQNENASFDLGSVAMPAVWGLVALAALARQDRERPLRVEMDYAQQACRFAHAVGMDSAIKGEAFNRQTEEGRTARVTRIQDWSQLDKVAIDVSGLLVKSKDEVEARLAIQYVLIELFRNVLQHSGDKLGGIVAAQRMDRGYEYDSRPRMQVAVADNGVGILDSLQVWHPEIETAEQALDMATWPYISGRFPKGGSSEHNAGLGLFFISEMAKLTAGRLLIASRGASMVMTGDLESWGNHVTRSFRYGYPGTLVVFELPMEVADYHGLISAIQDRARQRAPRFGQDRVLRYKDLPGDARRVSVSVLLSHGCAFAREQILNAIMRRSILILDFRGVHGLTQSSAHDLLFGALRKAKDCNVPIYASDIGGQVRSALDLLEGYAL